MMTAPLLLTSVGLIAGTNPARADEPVRLADAGPPSPDDPLAAKQAIVRDRMTQLEDRMFRLIELLAKDKPEQADRLEKGLRQAREMLIRRQMDEVIQLLEARDLTAAADGQQELLAKLEGLLGTLLTDPADPEQLREEMERLKAYRQEVRDILESQRELKLETSRRSSATQPSDAETPATDRLAAEQGELQAKAEALARKMNAGKKSGTGAESQPAEPSEMPTPSEPSDPGSDGERQSSGQGEDSRNPPDTQARSPSSQAPVPGGENVQRSSGHMQQAGDRLGEQKPESAADEQQNAINELEKALEELQRALDQLRIEQQEEILRGLEARFRNMLTRQLAVNEGTLALDEKEPSAWEHADDLTLAQIVREETLLTEEAGKALLILREEGTSIVFPRIVEQLEQDLSDATGRLRERQTGSATQALQAMIVQTLEQLVEALEQLQKSPASAGGGAGGGQGGEQDNLLPSSAELKMLRSCQDRVNNETEAVRKHLNEVADADPQTTDRIDTLAERQRELADMARKMHERMTGQ